MLSDVYSFSKESVA